MEAEILLDLKSTSAMFMCEYICSLRRSVSSLDFVGREKGAPICVFALVPRLGDIILPHGISILPVPHAFSSTLLPDCTHRRLTN
jgi:hypothetical protein